MAETYWQDKAAREKSKADKYRAQLDRMQAGVDKYLASPLGFFRNLIAKQEAQRKKTTPRITRPSEPRRSDYRYDRNTVVPLLYGKKPIDGIAIPIAKSGNYLYVIYIFCEGEIDSYVSYEIDGQAVSNFSGLYDFTEYKGTLTQTYDATLHSVDSNFVEPLTATAYVVARWKADDKFSGVPRLRAVIQGKKVYDHRITSTVYSTNPILCDIDRQMSTRYGSGTASSSIDWTTADAAADDCEVQANGEDRYELNYLISNPSSQEHVSDFILNHCNGERNFSQGKWHYYVHKARASVAHFDQDTVWGVTLSRPRQQDVINRARCSYVQTDDWREDEYSLETAELIAGTEPESAGHFDFTGCGSLSQVHRLATFQLNKRISDLFLTFRTYNTQGVERYDHFTFSHDVFSLSNQDFYVLSVDDDKITAIEYSTDLFTDILVSNPTLPEADLPLPTDVPDEITNLVITETTQEAQDGHTKTLLDVSWTASVFPWVKHYEIWTYKTGDSYQLYDTTTDTSCTIPTTSELTTHYVKIVTVSIWDVKSAGVADNEALSTVVAPLSAGRGFLETFEDDIDVIDAHWPSYNGSGETSRVSGGQAGGWVYKIGDNSGDDQRYMVWHKSIPYDPSKLYRLRIRIRQTAGTGTCYLGVAGRNAADDAWVDYQGNDNVLSGQYYTLGTSKSPGSTFVEYTGYLKGTAATGISTAAPDVSSPAALHEDCCYMRPLIKVNHNNTAGTFEIDAFTIDIIPEDADQIAESATNKWAAETGATVGATAGTNLYRGSGSTLDDSDVITSQGTADDVEYGTGKAVYETHADRTSLNTADNTDHVNGAETDSGYTYDVLGDLRLMNGKDIEFYIDDGSTKRGGIYATGTHLKVHATQFLELSVATGTITVNNTFRGVTAGILLGDSGYRWGKIYGEDLDISTGDVNIGSSSDTFTLHIKNGVDDGGGEYHYDAWIV